MMYYHDKLSYHDKNNTIIDKVVKLLSHTTAMNPLQETYFYGTEQILSW